jgi:hypothetical protein
VRTSTLYLAWARAVPDSLLYPRGQSESAAALQQLVASPKARRPPKTSRGLSSGGWGALALRLHRGGSCAGVQRSIQAGGMSPVGGVVGALGLGRAKGTP